MLYYWWNRYQTSGWEGLKEKPKERPCGAKLEKSLTERIIKLCKRYEWRPNKIEGYLHKNVDVNHHQVYRQPPKTCFLDFKPIKTQMTSA
jgi:transposase